MKEDGRKLRKEQQAEARRRAMLLLKKGWQERDIAEAVGVHERTVRQWKQHQRDHGTAAQEKEVQKLISDKLPEQLKLPFALWTRKAVAGLLQQRFGLQLPVRAMGEYLQRWGFTPQKPLTKAYEQNPRKVKAWLEQEYPQIAAQAKAEGAEITGATRPGSTTSPMPPGVTHRAGRPRSSSRWPNASAAR